MTALFNGGGLGGSARADAATGADVGGAALAACAAAMVMATPALQQYGAAFAAAQDSQLQAEHAAMAHETEMAALLTSLGGAQQSGGTQRHRGARSKAAARSGTEERGGAERSSSNGALRQRHKPCGGVPLTY
ncbi:hypothetical protein JKP88DRAFT_286904 [Tribonema minus]|uniref:Uncharacterized protein n=1 Tax=Tribonema minus TaxID=303371 RepID=A0A836CL12_9STRA|nr:hypothetical protein JKP88DRAFT_286904 [Tribonema minus]